jgi:GTPase
VTGLMDLVLEGFEAPPDETADGEKRVRVAFVGRPNVGKSTLVNALLGEQRMVAFDQPGTTRDSIEVPFEYGGVPHVLIDTAGIRRKGKVFESIEKFSVVKTLQAIERCNVAVLLLDGAHEVADQDAHIAGYILESGRALVVAVNKWDGLDAYARSEVKRELERKLHFLNWARVHYISALEGTGLAALMRSVASAHKAAFAKLATPKLTRALIAAVERQSPPRNGRFRPKMRYAHQGGQNPPLVVIHGNALSAVPDSYRRYLEGWFREQFDLAGTPLRIEFRTSTNPYRPDSRPSGSRPSSRRDGAR